MPPDRGFTAVLLAAQRPGVVDPLAAEAGVSHKCLVPIAGAPLIVHVAKALFATPGLNRLRVSVEPELVDALRELLAAGPHVVDYIPSAPNLADSVHAATRDLDEPTIVTTADNVLLTPGAVAQALAAIRTGGDVGIAMATQASVLAAHPDGQRRFYRFRDDAYSNCNLYAFSGRRAFASAESFRTGGQFAKKPLRLVAAVGPLNVILMLMRRLSLADAMRRLSRRFGVRVVPVVLADGSHAIDVDNRRTYDVAAHLLAQRALASSAGQAPLQADPLRVE